MQAGIRDHRKSPGGPVGSDVGACRTAYIRQIHPSKPSTIAKVRMDNLDLTNKVGGTAESSGLREDRYPKTCAKESIVRPRSRSPVNKAECELSGNPGGNRASNIIKKSLNSSEIKPRSGIGLPGNTIPGTSTTNTNPKENIRAEFVPRSSPIISNNNLLKNSGVNVREPSSNPLGEEFEIKPQVKRPSTFLLRKNSPRGIVSNEPRSTSPSAKPNILDNVGTCSSLKKNIYESKMPHLLNRINDFQNKTKEVTRIQTPNGSQCFRDELRSIVTPSNSNDTTSNNRLDQSESVKNSSNDQQPANASQMNTASHKAECPEKQTQQLQKLERSKINWQTCSLPGMQGLGGVGELSVSKLEDSICATNRSLHKQTSKSCGKFSQAGGTQPSITDKDHPGDSLRKSPSATESLYLSAEDECEEIIGGSVFLNSKNVLTMSKEGRYLFSEIPRMYDRLQRSVDWEKNPVLTYTGTTVSATSYPSFNALKTITDGMVHRNSNRLLEESSNLSISNLPLAGSVWVASKFKELNIGNAVNGKVNAPIYEAPFFQAGYTTPRNPKQIKIKKRPFQAQKSIASIRLRRKPFSFGMGKNAKYEKPVAEHKQQYNVTKTNSRFHNRSSETEGDTDSIINKNKMIHDKKEASPHCVVKPKISLGKAAHEKQDVSVIRPRLLYNPRTDRKKNITDSFQLEKRDSLKTPQTDINYSQLPINEKRLYNAIISKSRNTDIQQKRRVPSSPTTKGEIQNRNAQRMDHTPPMLNVPLEKKERVMDSSKNAANTIVNPKIPARKIYKEPETTVNQLNKPEAKHFLRKNSGYRTRMGSYLVGTGSNPGTVNGSVHSQVTSDIQKSRLVSPVKPSSPNRLDGIRLMSGSTGRGIVKSQDPINHNSNCSQGDSVAPPENRRPHGQIVKPLSPKHKNIICSPSDIKRLSGGTFKSEDSTHKSGCSFQGESVIPPDNRRLHSRIVKPQSPSHKEDISSKGESMAHTDNRRSRAGIAKPHSPNRMNVICSPRDTVKPSVELNGGTVKSQVSTNTYGSNSPRESLVPADNTRLNSRIVKPQSPNHKNNSSSLGESFTSAKNRQFQSRNVEPQSPNHKTPRYSQEEPVILTANKQAHGGIVSPQSPNHKNNSSSLGESFVPAKHRQFQGRNVEPQSPNHKTPRYSQEEPVILAANKEAHVAIVSPQSPNHKNNSSSLGESFVPAKNRQFQGKSDKPQSPNHKNPRYSQEEPVILAANIQAHSGIVSPQCPTKKSGSSSPRGPMVPGDHRRLLQGVVKSQSPTQKNAHCFLGELVTSVDTRHHRSRILKSGNPNQKNSNYSSVDSGNPEDNIKVHGGITNSQSPTHKSGSISPRGPMAPKDHRRLLQGVVKSHSPTQKNVSCFLGESVTSVHNRHHHSRVLKSENPNQKNSNYSSVDSMRPENNIKVHGGIVKSQSPTHRSDSISPKESTDYMQLYLGIVKPQSPTHKNAIYPVDSITPQDNIQSHGRLSIPHSPNRQGRNSSQGGSVVHADIRRVHGGNLKPLSPSSKNVNSSEGEPTKPLSYRQHRGGIVKSQSPTQRNFNFSLGESMVPRDNRPKTGHKYSESDWNHAKNALKCLASPAYQSILSGVKTNGMGLKGQVIDAVDLRPSSHTNSNVIVCETMTRFTLLQKD